MDHKTLLEKAVLLESEDCSFGYLGKSLLGCDIPLLQLGHGRLEVLYVGAERATDWQSAELLLCFAEEVTNNRGRRLFGIPVADWLACVTVYIVPMLNPDGVDYHFHGVCENNPIKERVIAMNGAKYDFPSWQANGRGVELCKNYATDFYARRAESGLSGGAPHGFCGEAPESEPEVAYLCGFLRHHRGIRGVLSLHCGVPRVSLWEHASPRSIRAAERLSEESGYPLVAGSECALVSYCENALHIPSFAIDAPLQDHTLVRAMADLKKSLYLFPTRI